MKKIIAWTLTAQMIVILLMLGIHWKRSRDADHTWASMRNLDARKSLVAEAVEELERFRGQCTSLRHLSPKASLEQSHALKKALRESINARFAELEVLSPTPEERALTNGISEQISELLLVGAQLERQIISRDIYQREEIRALHASILEQLTKLRDLATQRMALLGPEFRATEVKIFRLLAVAALTVVLLQIFFILRMYISVFRPLSRLTNYVRSIREGEVPPKDATLLPAAFGEIARSWVELHHKVTQQKREKQRFFSAVSQDLRSPLLALQSSTAILTTSESSTPQQIVQAMRLLKHSSYRLGKTIDDLGDLLELDRPQLKLDETIVDLVELLEKVSKHMGSFGGGSHHPIELVAPDTPVWISMDAARLERALIHLIDRITQINPQGCQIEITVTRKIRGPRPGVEILITERDPHTDSFAKSSVPEQEVLQHWISENGFGIALAHRIMESHGGTLRVAGLTGHRLFFTLRLPEERIGTITSSRGMRISSEAGFEIPRIEPVLAK